MKEILSKINIMRVLKYALFMLLALICQNMLFTQTRFFGICPMVLPAVAVSVGMFLGVTWGSVFSLIMGVFADMGFVENTMMFTILFPALAFAAGFVAQFFVNRRFFAFMVTAFAALFITAVVQMVITMTSDGFAASMLTTVTLQTLFSLPPAALAYFPPAKWIE